VQLGKMKTALAADSDFAIPLPPKQLIHEISQRDAAVARELNAAEDIH
jgi:hypothetical protein